MKPFLSVIIDVYVVAADIFRLRGDGNPIGIIAAHVLGIFIALVWMSHTYYPTSLVFIRDAHNHRIVVAADSLVRHRYSPPELQCKIHVVTNDCAIGMSGMYSQKIPPFDLFVLSRDACRNSGDLKQRADRFLSTVFPKVYTVVKYLATTDPDYLKLEYEGKPVIEVFFIGVYKQQPAVFARGAVLQNGILEPEAIGVPFDTDGLFSGVNDHITRYINSHPQWKLHGDISAARRLVTIEAHAHPDIVSLPISIGTVDSKGRFHWVEQGKCEGENPQPSRNTDCTPRSTDF